MPYSEPMRYRPGGRSDGAAIAALHADSWRRHYRGAYSDSYLDGDVEADRRAVWIDRMNHRDPSGRTIVAEAHRELVGFAYMILDEDPDWGALLDNLHVRARYKRQGIGARLLVLTALAVTERPEQSGLYLWVLEQNVDAQAFYRSCGGTLAGTRRVSAPGGVATRLKGSPNALRYAWPDPSALLSK